MGVEIGGGAEVGRSRGFFGGLLVVALTALLIAAPAAAEWRTATAVPGVSAADPDTAVEVGLSDDGGAAIAYRSGGQVRVATRETAAGSWSNQTIQETPAGSSSLDLEMNAAGDVAVGFLVDQAGGLAAVAYRPAGGSWEPTSILDTNTLDGGAGTLDLAINSDGDVVAGWSAHETGTPPKNVVRAVVRQKSGQWPAVDAYDTLVKEDDETGGGGVVLAPTPCGGPAVAIDDAGHALALWSGVYASFERSGGTEEVLCGLSKSNYEGGSWGGRWDITTRPPVGYMATSGSGPFVGAPVAASEPVRGALTLAFIEDTNVPGGVSGWATVTTAGRVDEGPIDGRETRRIGIAGEPAVGATGGYRAISTVETDDSGTDHAARAATGKAYFGFPLGATLTTAALTNPAIDAGGDNSAFALFDDHVPTRKVVAWTANGGGAFMGPKTLIEGNTTTPDVAANCHGDALFAAGGPAGLYFADYVSGNTTCGSGEDKPENAPGDGAEPSSATPPSSGPLEIVVGPPRSTDNGRVRVVLTTPKGGDAVFRGSAWIEAGGPATGSTKKRIVVTKKSVTFPGPGTQMIVLAPNARARRVIRRQGRLAAKLSIVFTAPGDPVATASRSILFKVHKGPEQGK
jgi:hypothetical protein